MKTNNEVKTVNAADLAKALKIKSDVRAGFISPVMCRACGLGGGAGGGGIIGIKA